MDVKAFPLGDQGAIPNHPRFALLAYSGAFPVDTSSTLIQKRFEANGWSNSWVDGVYSYHHFHSNTHEVLGCFAGSAEVLFGGENGVRLAFGAGDCLVIPAGVGHCKLRSSSGFGVVGAYPEGAAPDLCRAGDASPAVRARIQAAPRPRLDPVAGARGPLLQLWPA